VARLPIAQPITRREATSRTTARKKKPARVGTYVMSAAQMDLRDPLADGGVRQFTS